MADGVSVLMNLVINEIVKYHITGTDVKKDLQSMDGDKLRVKRKEIKAMGYSVGSRIMEIVATEQIWHKEEKETMRFMCKDFWQHLFDKQIDRLRTNNKGVYLLHDINFKWINCTALGPEEENSKSLVSRMNSFILKFTSGIIKGALNQIGVPSKVHGEFDNECIFTINLTNE